jgi:hypothetical protein
LPQIWQALNAKGAKTELALACFLVSSDSSGSIFEELKNAKGETPSDLLQADAELAPWLETVRSYRDRRRTVDNVQASIYQIEQVTQADANGELSRKSPVCANCHRRASSSAEPEENRLGTGGTVGTVGFNSCVHCGCTFTKSQMYHGETIILYYKCMNSHRMAISTNNSPEIYRSPYTHSFLNPPNVALCSRLRFLFFFFFFFFFFLFCPFFYKYSRA